MEIEEMVIRARTGDDHAFSELMLINKSMLYKTAFTYVRNQENALDILSEAIYKAYRSIKKLKEPAYFKTWLTRILINCCLDYLRKNKDVSPYAADEISAVFTAMEKDKDESLDLRNAVAGLDEKYKTIIILKYFHDLTITEIAEVLGCPLGTVKTNLHKALKELRIELKEEVL